MLDSHGSPENGIISIVNSCDYKEKKVSLQLTHPATEDIFLRSGSPFFIPIPDVHERAGAFAGVGLVICPDANDGVLFNQNKNFCMSADRSSRVRCSCFS
jgi:hypothetical protein